MSNTEQKVVGKDFIDDVMEFNGLDYQPTDQRVLAKSRTLIRSAFTKTSYSAPNEKATCYLSYGDAMIDPYNSYLMFDITLTDSTHTNTNETVTSQNGSALNIIDNINLRSRSGENIERAMNINIRQYHMLRWDNTFDYRDSIQSTFHAKGDVDYNNTKNSNNRTVCIPLSELGLGVFRPDRGVLLPAKLIAGMTVDIQFADNWTAFTHPNDASGKANSYIVSNMAFVLDSVVVSDQVLHLLNKQASSEEGLSLSWKSWAVQHNTLTAGTSVDVSFRSALSDALRGFVVLTDTTTPATDALKTTVNRMNSKAVDWTASQFKYGNNYYPLAQTTKSATGSSMEAYMQALYGFGVRAHGKCGVPYSTFIEANATNLRSTPAVVNLEASKTEDSVGVAVSSGRSIDFSGTVSASTTCDIYFFVEHLVKCKIFSTKIVIDT